MKLWSFHTPKNQAATSDQVLINWTGKHHFARLRLVLLLITTLINRRLSSTNRRIRFPQTKIVVISTNEHRTPTLRTRVIHEQLISERQQVVTMPPLNTAQVRRRRPLKTRGRLQRGNYSPVSW